jgi:hypothetical protein
MARIDLRQPALILAAGDRSRGVHFVTQPVTSYISAATCLRKIGPVIRHSWIVSRTGWRLIRQTLRIPLSRGSNPSLVRIFLGLTSHK